MQKITLSRTCKNDNNNNNQYKNNKFFDSLFNRNQQSDKTRRSINLKKMIN